MTRVVRARLLGVNRRHVVIFFFVSGRVGRRLDLAFRVVEDSFIYIESCQFLYRRMKFHDSKALVFPFLLYTRVRTL